jgi:hypothetical protein
MTITIAWIHLGFTSSKSFQKENYLMRPITSEIFCNQFLNCVRNTFGIVTSFMQTMLDPIWSGSLKNFMSKILCELHSSTLFSWFSTLILFLFRYVSHCLTGHSYHSEKALLDTIHTIFRNHFEGHVQGLDGETCLSRCIWRPLLFIK